MFFPTVPEITAVLPADGPAKPQEPSCGDHVPGHGPIDVDVFAGGNDVPVHCTFHAYAVTGHVDISLDVFILTDGGVRSTALFGCRRSCGQQHKGAQSGKQERER